MGENWYDEVLDFWFTELTPEDWFTGRTETDTAIRERFQPLYDRLKETPPPAALEDPRAALAAVLVFDQFPRNIFRKQAAAFATDELAMRYAGNAVDKGLDSGMSEAERQFLYMPFMHSEVLADQERCVMLFRSLSNEEALKYAIEHRDIIARFGRFPHRNRVLDRESTGDELAFLREHEGFGQ